MDVQDDHDETERMLAMAAHDLRQPLRQLNMRLALLLRRAAAELSPELLSEVQAASDEGKKLQSLLTDLLAWAGGGDAVPVQTVLLDDVAESAQQLLTSLIMERGVVVERLGPLPKVQGRAGDLERVLMNLIKNAIDHASPGVRICLRPYQRDGLVGLMVDDSGPGIAEKDQARIFAPFDRGATGQVGGHGLGLAICRRLLTDMGGDIGLGASQLGGAAFYVLLPAAAESELIE